MFAAHRLSCTPPSLLVSHVLLRRATALGVLLAALHPACSADRFNSTDNAAAQGADPSDTTSAAAETNPDASSSHEVSDASRGDAGAGSRSTDSDVSITSGLLTRDSISSNGPAASSDASSETGLASTESGSTSGASTALSSIEQSTAVSSNPSVDADSTQDSSNLESDATWVLPTSAPSSVVTDAGVDASVSTDVGEPPADSSDTADTATTHGSEPLESAEITNDSSHGQTNTGDSGPGETSGPPVVCAVTRTLPGTVRDFSEDHPDMEPCDEVDCRAEKGLVEPTLGSDDKPVLAANRDESSTVRSAETFNQWFNDVPGVNTAISFPLRITTQRIIPLPQRIGFDSSNPPPGSPAGFNVAPRGFFPIDELNTTERPHNYSFTYEVTSFIEYRGGETLTVRGDDDIFVFIDRRLVIDLGGIHLPQEGTVDLDTLGLERGRVYDFRIFFAERHVEQSNLYLSTTARFMECTSG